MNLREEHTSVHCIIQTDKFNKNITNYDTRGPVHEFMLVGSRRSTKSIGLDEPPL